VSPPAFERALAASLAVSDDQLTVGEAALDAADVASGVVAQHMASIDVRLDTPDGPVSPVSDDAGGIDVIAGGEEVRGGALTGRRGGGSNGEGKKKGNDGGLHGVLKGNV